VSAERPRDGAREWALAAGLLVLGLAAYALFVVQDYSGPLVGGRDYEGNYRGDANYFEFLGYYVRDHYRFGLAPISFLTTDVAYPHGTHIGLLSWCAERDLFHAAMLRLFGPGAWLQLYVTLGMAIGAVGVTAVLRPSFGVLRASLVGFAASFFNFYAWYKFPYHVNCAAVHWVNVSIALDAATMRAASRGERLRTSQLVLRVALVALSMGLDLGYVAGHALTSFVITAYYVWSELGLRDRRLLARFALIFPESPREDLRREPGAIAIAAALASVAIAFYLPFVAAVVKDTAAYPMTEANGNFWASQLHALFPYFPGVHPTSSLVRGLFGADEGIGEYAPGYTLLAAAGIGIALTRKRGARPVFEPHLVMAILVFVFHPRWTKTLQMFPWFAYYRVAGRGTLVLPILLALVAASTFDWPKLAKRVVGALAAIEFATATLLVSEYRPAPFEPAVKAYFETVAKAPGQALLEWPFCIASANVTITRELCPYWDITSTAYANRRFHGKSTISVYLSRVHPLQFKRWIDEGWEGMFMPDDPTREHPKRELRCFDDAQWARFDVLYTQHDFAGIQLYADLLPGACVEAFHARYGAPAAEATLPRGGRVEFLPRAAR
jgi:hypothetical protein